MKSNIAHECVRLGYIWKKVNDFFYFQNDNYKPIRKPSLQLKQNEYIVYFTINFSIEAKSSKKLAVKSIAGHSMIPVL